MSKASTRPDYRDLRKWFKAPPSDPNGFWHSFPVERVVCAICRSAGCLMYPAPFQDEGAPQTHKPSTICPRCSGPNAEAFLRYRAEEQGYTLKPIGVFTTGTTPVAA